MGRKILTRINFADIFCFGMLQSSTVMNTEILHEISPSREMFDALQKAFVDFQMRAELLSAAYSGMRTQFKKVNVELDAKNIQLAESLKKQEEVQLYLSSILASMNSGVVGIDIMGTITHFNRTAEEITGYVAADVIGKPYTVLDIHNSADEPTLMDVLHAPGAERKRDEKVYKHRNGHPVPVWFQMAQLRDPQGRTIGAVEIFSDISRIKALEEEMQHTKTMAALGEMAATIAHEIRNPLGAMGMWAGLLERDIGQADECRKPVQRILEGLSRLNRIVSNLLVYSRPVKAQFRKIVLQDVVRETIDFVRIEKERKGQSVEVKTHFHDAHPAYIMADPEKLHQIIMNLCINAIQAMPDGGTLTVTVNGAGSKQTGFVMFSVGDTGTGIAPEHRDKIFDPFYTTKENGTGLGLAIVKKIVESHSGHIDVQSEVGKGTTMSVFFPAEET
jgi:PAS domain S-box-containing protein